MNEVFDPYAPQDSWEADSEAEMESYIYPMDIEEMKDFVAFRFSKEVENQKLSQAQAAIICEISQSRVSNIINDPQKISLEYMLNACAKLGVNFNLRLAD
ncbi:transcriptional regulatory protein [Shigella phage vB_SflM_004]|uniref:Transcriptional regulatory protein n=2 Tax=Mooglevirus moogle TaxID=1985304 RepID=A0A0A0RQ54_9CAUD|nr:transcriptional regulator [Citrobacter phage Moogle]AIW03784.1 transcriptional regulatory protein [Citrobacter phage Moogle]ARB06543.1 transcriptional regulatory protein [Citrobacter phage Mijalis]AZV01461.1 transcriptional regulatory protein [Shigella phage vB_SflM_004]